MSFISREVAWNIATLLCCISKEDCHICLIIGYDLAMHSKHQRTLLWLVLQMSARIQALYSAKMLLIAELIGEALHTLLGRQTFCGASTANVICPACITCYSILFLIFLRKKCDSLKQSNECFKDVRALSLVASESLLISCSIKKQPDSWPPLLY